MLVASVCFVLSPSTGGRTSTTMRKAPRQKYIIQYTKGATFKSNSNSKKNMKVLVEEKIDLSAFVWGSYGRVAMVYAVNASSLPFFTSHANNTY